jgi:hypothetical protein
MFVVTINTAAGTENIAAREAAGNAIGGVTTGG